MKNDRHTAYIRTIPKIFGYNFFDKNSILNSNNTIYSRFVASIFTCELTINSNKNLSISPFSLKQQVNALVKNNDEIVRNHINNTQRYSDLLGDKIILPLIRPGADIYGHWLLDILPKLNIFKKLYPDTPFSILLDNDSPGWVMDLIDIFCNDYCDVLKIKQNQKVSGKFFLMSPIRQHDFICEYSKIMPQKINYKTFFRKKVYLSRSMLGTNYRGLTNKSDIEELFVNNGFDIVYPETLSIREQISLFSSVKVLAGEAGSGLHNSIFCKPKTNIINIQSSRQNHFIQSGLCYWYKQKATYVFGQAESDDWNANFTVSKESCQAAINSVL